VVLSERPEGRGFGGAALALTAQFGMKPATRNGRPVHSTATLPVNFTGNAPSGGRKVASATQAWAEAPSYADVVRAYPRRAAEARRAGRVTLGCRVTEAGRLVGCNAISQQPKGQGFADAAKDLAKTFRADLNEEERRLAGKFVVHLPFVFDPAMLSEGKPVVGRPKWVKLPSADDMRSAIAPLKLTATARAQLECVVQPGGGVGDCKVVSEEPAGSGVGAAALTLAPKFRLTTWTSEGLPAIGGDVRIPLRFEP
jgi:TonB family protein